MLNLLFVYDILALLSLCCCFLLVVVDEDDAAVASGDGIDDDSLAFFCLYNGFNVAFDLSVSKTWFIIFYGNVF